MLRKDLMYLLTIEDLRNLWVEAWVEAKVPMEFESSEVNYRETMFQDYVSKKLNSNIVKDTPEMFKPKFIVYSDIIDTSKSELVEEEDNKDEIDQPVVQQTEQDK